jgi:hypothetical protein
MTWRYAGLFVVVLAVFFGCVPDCGYQIDTTPNDNCADGSWHTLSDGSECCGEDASCCAMECDVVKIACTIAAYDDLVLRGACYRLADSCREECK